MKFVEPFLAGAWVRISQPRCAVMLLCMLYMWSILIIQLLLQSLEVDLDFDTASDEAVHIIISIIIIVVISVIIIIISSSSSSS